MSAEARESTATTPLPDGLPSKTNRSKYAAIEYAKRGKPVFPCKPDKSPYTPRGFKDATTDPARVTALWTQYRGEKIGMPTGKASGIFVVDVDRLEALAELDPELRRKLHEALTVRTPSGGLHYYLSHIEGVTNKAGRLPNGIDIRGEGGYVIVPPSEGYTVEHHALIADAPDRLLEALRDEPRGKAGGPGHSRPLANILDNSGQIPEGRRNVTLTSIAGRLRARGYDRTAILDALLQENASRCERPLSEAEVEGIARSAEQWAPGTSSPGPSPEVLEALDAIEADVLDGKWSGMGRNTDRDILISLSKKARLHGTMVPGGVRVQESIRELAEEAAVGSTRTVWKSINRLRAAGWIRRDGIGSGVNAGAFVIIKSKRAKGNTLTSFLSVNEDRDSSVSPCAPPLTAPRLRWSTAEIRRLGKTCGAVLDHLEAAGGKMQIDELYGSLNPGKSPEDKPAWRPRDLRRRAVARLEAAGVVECSGTYVCLSTDWLELLNRERRRAGEVDALLLQMERHDREQRAFREAWKKGEVLSKDELAKRRRNIAQITREAAEARRRERDRRSAAGGTDELENLSLPTKVVELYPLLNKPVLTRRGRGMLWQAFSDRVGVVLDDAPGAVTFMDLAELVG